MPTTNEMDERIRYTTGLHLERRSSHSPARRQRGEDRCATTARGACTRHPCGRNRDSQPASTERHRDRDMLVDGEG